MKLRRSKRIQERHPRQKAKKKKFCIEKDSLNHSLCLSKSFQLIQTCNLFVNEICRYLLPEEIVALGLVDKCFCMQLLFSESCQLWADLCARLWQDKLHVADHFKQNPSASSYFGSIVDSKRQQFKSRDELCSIDFHFKFKRDAGEYWVAHDPSYFGDIPMYRRFKLDGTLSRKQRSVQGSERNLHAISSAFDIMDFPEITSAFPKIRWKFTRYKNGVRSQYIKLNDWPALEIYRLPNWGWRLENLWTRYQSCSSDTVTNRF